MRKQIYKFIKSLLLLLAFTPLLHSQSMDTPFGKNRVQYHKNFAYWDKYESDNFIVYWYGRNKYLGQSVVQMAELDHDEIRKLIEHKINDKLEIIVYTDLSDMKQSNIGVEEAFQNTSGETKIAGNKMYVYYDGNHQNLRKSIRSGIASVYLGALLLGTNFQEVLQGTVLEELPEWYTAGLVSFAGDYWNILIEDELRDVVLKDKKMFRFDKLAEKHPRLAGHSFWNFISQQYGKSTITNVVYLTKISRDVDEAFEFVLNTPFKTLISEWSEYYQNIFNEEKGKFEPFANSNQLKLKNKKYRPVSHVAMNSKEDKLAYMVNDKGSLRLYIYDFETQKSEQIWKQGYKNLFQQTDYEYPLLTWHPNKDELTFGMMQKNKFMLYKYETGAKKPMKQALPFAFQRVYSISYFDDRYYLLSASVEGVSDLFQYDSERREFVNLTSDYHDDIDASFTTLSGEKGIIFSSNRGEDYILPERIDTVLPIKNFDIFFWPYPKPNTNAKEVPKLARRLTNTKGENERYPKVIQEDKVIFLSGLSGVINTHFYDDETNNTYALSNVSRNLIRHEVNNEGTAYYFSTYHEGQYKVYYKDITGLNAVAPYFTEQKKWVNSQLDQYMKQLNKESTNPYKPASYTFQSRFKDTEDIKPIKAQDAKPILPAQTQNIIAEEIDESVFKYIPQQVTAAGLQYKFHNVTARMDNEVLFEGLELFGGQNPQTNQLPVGFLAKATVSDLFEDYQFEGGVRLQTNLKGSEYFITFENNKNLLDKKYALYRRAFSEPLADGSDPDARSSKEQIVAQYQLKYPLNIYSSFRAISSLRFDRNIQKSRNETSFNAQVERDKRIGLRLEYVFDNSYDHMLNIMRGSRMKVFSEAFNQFNINIVDGFDFEASKGFTAVVGADLRHYVPIIAHSVLALRASTAFSFGNQLNLYYLGGMNNQFINSFNQKGQIAPGEYAFQTNANHLRGFDANTRNGTRYGLVNTELRIPIFRYLLGKNRGMSLIRNLQLTGFADAGIAWYGRSPFDKQNPINKEFVEVPNIKVEVNYFRDPVIASYGFGARTMLFGYFLKLDYAYGVETRLVQQPKLHVSMGLDF